MLISLFEKGYHLLLEKPMAVTLADCRAIASAVRDAGVIFAIGHVLRYSSRIAGLRSLIDSGAIGEVCFSLFPL